MHRVVRKPESDQRFRSRSGAIDRHAQGRQRAHPGNPSALGSALLALFLFLLAAGLVLSLKPYASRIAIRILGSWIATTGLLMLGWRLRR